MRIWEAGRVPLATCTVPNDALAQLATSLLATHQPVDSHRPDSDRSSAPAARAPVGPLRTLLTLMAMGTTAVVLAVGLAGVWRFFVPPVPTFDPDAEPRIIAARGDLAEDERATIELFERSVPSAISIVTSSAGIFQGRTAQGRGFEMGTGSGFIWNAEGIVVTNHHVVRGARTILVSLDEREAPFLATLIGSSEEHDIAVLKIDVRKAFMRPVPIGSSSELRVGQKVFAIGAPFGLQRSLSTGVIGATERLIEDENGRSLAGLIQTDAAINPGNSGGPLLDSAGRLIGMNTAIASRTGTFSGIGFAVPVDTINWVVPHLLRTGTPPRPGIGVRLEDPAQVALMGLEGALVRFVHEGSAAARAGLRGQSLSSTGEDLGDLIVGVNGERVASPDDLRALLVRYAVGESVTLDIVRSGRREQRVVELGSLDGLER